MADVELLPLPEPLLVRGDIGGLHTGLECQHYARANVEHHTASLQAENERLRADLDRAIVELAGPEPTDGSAYYWACRVNGARRKAGASAERLAEALRNSSDTLERLAFAIRAPNEHTPQLVELAIAMRAAALAEEDRND